MRLSLSPNGSVHQMKNPIASTCVLELLFLLL